MIRWLRAWWEDHHCVICGKFMWEDGGGYHWECMRPLLGPLP